MDKFKIFLRKIGLNLKEYLRASLIISFINFIILLFGLSLGGVPHYIGIALLISIIDFLPLVGSNIILIPWLVYTYFNANSKLTLILIIIVISNLLLEQLIKPILQGSSVGIKPIYSIIINILCMIFLSPIWGIIVGTIISVVLGVIMDMKKIDKLTNSDSMV